jgi:hypothetical protein
MAQISTTSTGTTLSGGDGGGTHSGIMSVLNTIRYLKLLQAINNNRAQEEQPNSEQPKETSDLDEPVSIEVDVPIEVEFTTEAPYALLGKNTNAIEGKDRKLLTPAPDGLTPKLPPIVPLATAVSQVTRDKDLNVAVRIGDFYVADAHPNIAKHLESMSREHEEALSTALEGKQPKLPVDIIASDNSGKSIRFGADSKRNQGWSVDSNSSTLNISAEHIDQQMAFQSSPVADKVRALFGEIFEGSGPHVIEGKSEDIKVLVADNLVVVVDGGNRVLDAVKISQKTGEIENIFDSINGNTAREQGMEAAADFQHLVTQSRTFSVKSRKAPQRQIEP